MLVKILNLTNVPLALRDYGTVAPHGTVLVKAEETEVRRELEWLMFQGHIALSKITDAPDNIYPQEYVDSLRLRHKAPLLTQRGAKEVCRVCAGSGRVDGPEWGAYGTCPTCCGSGRRERAV